MTPKASTYVTPEDRPGVYRWFTITPTTMYPPALVDLIKLGRIRRDDALLAVTPFGTLSPDSYQAERRKEVLELARIHFQTCLLEELGDGIGIHILEEPSWAWR